jgi:hypothetical protein
VGQSSIVFALMVDAPESPTSPPRGAAIDIFKIAGGHFRISIIAPQGGPHACFFLPRDILQLNGRRSQTSSNAPQGGAMSRMFFNENFLGPYAAKDLEKITTKVKIQNSYVGRRDNGPTCWFVTSPEVDPGAIVSILQTRYPHVQASRQDN